MAWWWAGVVVLLGPYFHAMLTRCTLIMNASQLAFCLLFLLCMMRSWKTKQNKKTTLYTSMFSLLFTYFCLSLFLLLFVNHFSFVFCLICLPSANAFHPRVCRLQPLQPSGLQQPPAGRELRRLQQGNELMEGFGGGGRQRKRTGDGFRQNRAILKRRWHVKICDANQIRQFQNNIHSTIQMGITV